MQQTQIDAATYRQSGRRWRVAAMNGVDAIVTAGIGENAIPVREKVVLSDTLA